MRIALAALAACQFAACARDSGVTISGDVPGLDTLGLRGDSLPAQTERMVAALRSRGVAVEYHCYADERHGFRQAAHLAHALEAELGFYRQLLSS